MPSVRMPGVVMTHRRRLACCLLFVLTVLAATSAAEEPKGPAALGTLVSQIAAFFPPLSGEVIEVRDKNLILSVGRRQGAQVGMEFSLVREGRELRHPKTAEVLGRVEQELGLAVVAQVSETSSVATVARGGGVRPGDRVRISAGPVTLTVAALGSEGVSPGLLETVYNELAAELTATRRFRVISGDAFAAAAAQAHIPAERVIQGEGLAVTATRQGVRHLLVLWVKQVEAKPFVEVRLFSILSGRETAPVLSAGLFVPSSINAASASLLQQQALATQRQFSTSREPQQASRPSRSFLARLFLGEVESESPSAGNFPMPLREVKRLRFPVLAMDVAVSPKDKVPRLVVTDGERIYLYRIVGRTLEIEWTYVTDETGQIISVQLADLDGDGLLEVVGNRYSPLTHIGPTSFILTTREGKAAAVVQSISQILFAVDTTGDGIKRTLWAQRFNADTFFTKGRAERYVLRDGKLVADGSVQVPRDFRVTGAILSNIAGAGARALAYVDDQHRFAIASGGNEMWRSAALVGSAGHLKLEGQTDRASRNLFYSLEPMPLAVDLDGDGVEEIVLPENQVRGKLAVVSRSPNGYRLQTFDTGFGETITGLGAVAGSPAPTLILSVVYFEGLLAKWGETSIVMTTSK